MVTHQKTKNMHQFAQQSKSLKILWTWVEVEISFKVQWSAQSKLGENLNRWKRWVFVIDFGRILWLLWKICLPDFFVFYLFVFFLSAQVRLSAQPKVFAIKQAPRALIDHIRYIEFKHYIKDILNVNEWNPETAYKANATEKKIFEEQVGSLKTENEKTSRS